MPEVASKMDTQPFSQGDVDLELGEEPKAKAAEVKLAGNPKQSGQPPASASPRGQAVAARSQRPRKAEAECERSPLAQKAKAAKKVPRRASTPASVFSGRVGKKGHKAAEKKRKEEKAKNNKDTKRRPPEQHSPQD